MIPHPNGDLAGMSTQELYKRLEPEKTLNEIKSERHNCERCGYDLDNGHEYGPLEDFSYLCFCCHRQLMQQDPKRYPLA